MRLLDPSKCKFVKLDPDQQGELQVRMTKVVEDTLQIFKDSNSTEEQAALLGTLLGYIALLKSVVENKTTSGDLDFIELL